MYRRMYCPMDELGESCNRASRIADAFPRDPSSLPRRGPLRRQSPLAISSHSAMEVSCLGVRLMRDSRHKFEVTGCISSTSLKAGNSTNTSLWNLCYGPPSRLLEPRKLSALFDHRKLSDFVAPAASAPGICRVPRCWQQRDGEQICFDISLLDERTATESNGARNGEPRRMLVYRVTGLSRVHVSRSKWNFARLQVEQRARRGECRSPRCTYWFPLDRSRRHKARL